MVTFLLFLLVTFLPSKAVKDQINFVSNFYKGVFYPNVILIFAVIDRYLRFVIFEKFVNDGNGGPRISGRR